MAEPKYNSEGVRIDKNLSTSPYEDFLNKNINLINKTGLVTGAAPGAALFSTPGYTAPSSTPTTGLTSGAGDYQSFTNKVLGTNFGNTVGLQPDNTYGYTGADGQQAYTGDLSNNPEALASLKALDGTALSGTTFGVDNSTWKGLSTGVGLGLEGLGTITDFLGYQDQKKQNEYNRGFMDEQRQQARDEIARVKKLRADTSANYFRDTAKNPGRVAGE